MPDGERSSSRAPTSGASPPSSTRISVCSVGTAPSSGSRWVRLVTGAASAHAASLRRPSKWMSPVSRVTETVGPRAEPGVGAAEADESSGACATSRAAPAPVQARRATEVRTDVRLTGEILPDTSWDAGDESSAWKPYGIHKSGLQWTRSWHPLDPDCRFYALPRRPYMRGHRLLASVVLLTPILLAPIVRRRSPTPRRSSCVEPYRVSRGQMLQAMGAHGDYSLTATTTSMRFGAEALLELVRRLREEAPQNTRLYIDQDDWFTAHREIAGVTYFEMSAAARSGFEHHQNALVDYGPHVVEEVVEGPAPITALSVTISWPNSTGSPSSFTYKDTLSVPRVEVYDSRVIRFKLVQYEDMLLFDQVEGISVKPLCSSAASTTLLRKPDLEQTRLAVSTDQWQVMRGRVKVFLGISKTGTAAIEPNGRGHEGVPTSRSDLEELEQRLERPLKLRYGAPSC